MTKRLMIGFLTAAMTLALLFAPPAVPAGEPSREPILRVETGMHTSMIWRIGVDASERFLATASNDKTVRIWDLKSGRLLRILRPPIEPGNEGKLYSVAISPDGQTVAAGGWTGYEWDQHNYIYLFDRQSGRLIHRITNLPNVIFNMNYSDDGAYLVAGLGQQNGIRIYQTPKYQLVGQDLNYGDNSYGSDFDSSGRLVTSCRDGFVRLYDSKFRLVAKQKAPGGDRPFAVSFSPDGRKVAVGFQDGPRVSVLSAQNLAPLYDPYSGDFKNGSLDAVCWSRDGRYLYAGGRYDVQGVSPVVRWDDGGRGKYRHLDGSLDTLLELIPLSDGSLVYGAADPAWAILSPDGKKALAQNPVIADHRASWTAFLLSADGGSVGFGYKYGGNAPASFSIDQRELLMGTEVDQTLLQAKTTQPGLNVENWKGQYNPSLNGKSLGLDQYERARCLAFQPDGKGFVLGSEWHLRLFDGFGNEVWKITSPGVAWAVNVGENGRVLAAAFGDGTIRWFRVADGRMLLSLFPHQDRRWVLWTPSGYYDASAGGEDLIGWHLNRSKDEESDFFPASRFRSAFYRPDVVGKILDTLDEAGAVRMANAETPQKERALEIEEMLPPVVNIIAPRDGEEVKTENVTIRYLLRSPGGEKVTGLKILIDGRPTDQGRGVKIDPPADSRKAAEYEITVTIPKRDVEIGLIAENAFAASQPAILRLKWAGSTEEFKIKPKLYVLAVGVGDYENDDLDLAFPAKDAKDFAAVLASQQGGLYREVVTRVLADDEATKGNILDGLDWIGRETTAKDVAVIYLSGQGINDQVGDYYYLPANAELERLRRTGLPFVEIKKTVATLPGKTLFFVDTSHSGGGADQKPADINALVNELASAESGAVVFASTAGQQLAIEDQSWGNGAFARALIEGLSGQADFTGQGRITINMLDMYVAERVRELTGGKQTPSTTRPETIQDYEIGITK